MGDLKGAARGEAEAIAGLTLEAGEIVEEWSRLSCRLGDLLDFAGFAHTAVVDGLGGGLIPEAFGLLVRIVFVLLEVLIEPASFVATSFDFEQSKGLEVRAGFEGLNLPLPLGKDGEGGGLDTTDRRQAKATVARVHRGEGAGAVDADDPVRLGAAFGGIGERLHLLLRAKIGPGIKDGSLRHRLEPEALGGLLGFRRFDDVAENELALATGVTGVDQGVDIFAADELLEDAETVLAGVDGLEIEFLGEDGKMSEAPSDFLAVHRGHSQFQEVTDGRGDDVSLVFVPVFFLGKFGHARGLRQRTGEVGSDAGFFRNDEGFGHDNRLVVTLWGGGTEEI